MDAQYREYIELAEPLLTERALLVIDNLLVGGEVALPEGSEGRHSAESVASARAEPAAAGLALARVGAADRRRRGVRSGVGVCCRFLAFARQESDSALLPTRDPRFSRVTGRLGQAGLLERLLEDAGE